MQSDVILFLYGEVKPVCLSVSVCMYLYVYACVGI